MTKEIFEVLNTMEAAALLRVHDVTLRRLAASGHIPARKVGRDWRFSREVLLKWLEGDVQTQKQELAISRPKAKQMKSLNSMRMPLQSFGFDKLPDCLKSKRPTAAQRREKRQKELEAYLKAQKL